MSVTCVIQARTGSTRLPGKVLMDVAGRPMLGFMLDRLADLAVDHLVVATSTLSRDDPIEAVARDAGVAVVRGCEADVLARFATALDEFPATDVVRLTADCPLTDPAIVEAVVARHRATGAAYTSNVLPRTFPKGLDVEVIMADALRTAAVEAVDPVEREHVTPFVQRRPERFRLANLRAPAPLGREWWTVDTAADLERVRSVVARVGNPRASWTEILALVGVVAGPGPGELWLRPADTGDSERLYAWRNDAESVRWSATPLPVERCDHERWLQAALDDAGRRIWIGEVDGVAVGQVRVDVRAGIATVSISVDAEHRGHGAGGAMLRALRHELLGDAQTVGMRALVHPANVASLRSFTRAGFDEAGVDPGTGFLVLTCPRTGS